MPSIHPTPHCYALIPCAGVGARAGGVLPKQYQTVAGEPLVLHTVRALARVERIQKGLLVLAPDDDFEWPSTQWPLHFERVHAGGQTRAQTVLNGLRALRGLGVSDGDWVLVHDAARCLISPALINDLIDACLPDAVGGLLALPLADTLKQADHGRVGATVNRSDKWLAQTPQMFRMQMLEAALASHEATHFAGITDEASAIEAAGHAPLLVPGSAHNFKVTYPPDLALAQAVLLARQNEATL